MDGATVGMAEDTGIAEAMDIAVGLGGIEAGWEAAVFMAASVSAGSMAGRLAEGSTAAQPVTAVAVSAEGMAAVAGIGKPAAFEIIVA